MFFCIFRFRLIDFEINPKPNTNHIIHFYSGLK
jgi:hypothetical protein